MKNGGIRIYSHDVLIQHIAIRPGALVNTATGWDLTSIDNRDCIGVGDGARKIVVDHITCTWTTDELGTTWAQKPDLTVGLASDITFSNNIFAYPLWFGGHTGTSPKHGFGVLVGTGSSNVTLVRNVMAFAESRNPLIRAQTNGAQVVNNFVFRPGAIRSGVIYAGKKFESSPPNVAPFFDTKISAIGNLAYLMRAREWHGMTNSAHQEGFYVSQNANLDLYVYLNGNYTYQPDAPGLSAFQPTSPDPAAQYSQPYYAYNPNNPTDPNNGRMIPDDGVHRLTLDPWANLNSSGATWTPILGPPAYLKWKIVPGAGKFAGQRDFYDTDLMKKINDPDDDSAWLHSEADLGAQPWAPVDIQNTRPFNVVDPTGNSDGDGYTNLEEELHRLAAIVEGRIPTDPAVSKFDFFTDDASEGWTTAVAGTGGSWAVSGKALVQSALDQNSRAMLNGSNWTDQVVDARVDASQFNGTSFVAVYARFKSVDETYYMTLRSTGALELKRIKDNEVETYATKPAGTYDALAPHVLRLEVVGNSLRGYVDNSLALSGTDDEWGIDSGQAGVGTFQASAAFDNVFASPFPSGSRVTDDFEDHVADGWSMAETGAGSWLPAAGSPNASNWMLKQTQTAGNHRAVRAASGRDQATQAKVRLGTASDPNGFVAVYARYQDVSNAYYALLRSNRKLELKKIVGGNASVTMASLDLPTDFNLSAWHTLRIEASGGKLTTLKAYLDGQLQLVGSDVDNPFVLPGNAAFGTYAHRRRFRRRGAVEALTDPAGLRLVGAVVEEIRGGLVHHRSSHAACVGGVGCLQQQPAIHVTSELVAHRIQAQSIRSVLGHRQRYGGQHGDGAIGHLAQ